MNGRGLRDAEPLSHAIPSPRGETDDKARERLTTYRLSRAMRSSA
jgi:hypothetical protein